MARERPRGRCSRTEIGMLFQSVLENPSMALDLTPEQKELGRTNFRQVSNEINRRGFLKGLLTGGAVAPVAAAAYFGYNFDKFKDRPVKAALIGAGDEGGVLVGEH